MSNLSEHDQQVARVVAKSVADFCWKHNCQPFPELVAKATLHAMEAVEQNEAAKEGGRS